MTQNAPDRISSGESTLVANINSFPSVYHADIKSFVLTTPQATELARTFPALLFALATNYATPRKQRQALRLVTSGAPLKDASDVVGLPWWLRKIPPACFNSLLVDFPDDQDFHRRVASLIPSDPLQILPWYQGISIALKGAGPDYALWAARWLPRQHRAVGLPGSEHHFWMLTAWAWHSNTPDTDGHRLVRRPWTPQISLRRSIEELESWRQRMLLATLLNAEANDTWLKGGDALGYSFIPLKSAQEFVLESENMSNCLDQYADHFSRDFSRVFSIRKNNRSVANIEIGLDGQDGRMPAILQLRGPRNRRTSAELWRAAYVWLGAQPLKPRTLRSTRLDPTRLDEAEQRTWAQYLKWLKSKGADDAFRASLKPSLDVCRRLPRSARGSAVTASRSFSPPSSSSVSPERMA